jgi:MOSC domain-containing protein YiiM
LSKIAIAIKVDFMHLISVNLASQETIEINNKVVETGIFKYPVQKKVRVNAMGLVGDTVVDTTRHSGRDQAVYLYSAEDYDWWTSELNRKLPIGIFGENLTLSSFGVTSLRVGDRLRINTVLLEITFARIPCATLGVRMGDATFVQHFIQAKRPGVYARVLESGDLQVGDSVDFLPTPNNFPTVIELYELWHAKERDPKLLYRGLEAPIAERAKAAFQFWLEHS